MGPLELARSYLRGLQALDGSGVAALFTPDGVLDDGIGGHHSGRAAIQRFIESLRMRISVEEVRVLETPDRVTVFGYLASEQLERSPFRWVFHLRGERIAHLGNSFLQAFPAA
jgi:hypothetical protein